MTFTEAALEILRREGQPLHFKELTERAMTKKLLTFVGRTPEVTMQTQLTAAVKKAPGNPFVRVKPGVFGLLRYPEISPEEKEAAREAEKAAAEMPRRNETKPAESRIARAPDAKDDKKRERPEKPAVDAAGDERSRRRRRRGGRGRTGGKDSEAPRPAGTGIVTGENVDTGPDDGAEELSGGGLSPEARAAALAETGVLEGNDDMMSADDDAEGESLQSDRESGDRTTVSRPPVGGAVSDTGSDIQEGDDEGDEGDDANTDDGEGGAFGTGDGAGTAASLEGEAGHRRRRRRRRRRGAGEGEGPAGTGAETPRSSDTASEGSSSRSDVGNQSALPLPDGGEAGNDTVPASGEVTRPAEPGGETGQPARRIMAPVDAAIEILRGQPPGRGVHVRQIADSAIRRRLIHGEPNEAWRVIRTALAAEPKDRLRNGMRPRVRSAGSGLFALARRTPDPDLEKAEQVFGEARRALRERTIAALEKRLSELPPGAFEALARVLLQREGFGPTTFVKRVDGTIYVEALRGRGVRPSKCLIALRPGGTTAGRRAIGELRAGVRAREQDEGLLMLAGRLAEDAISEWKQAGSPMEIADGAALAETCARHGVGVLPAVLNVDFVDADFFAELAEG